MYNVHTLSTCTVHVLPHTHAHLHVHVHAYVLTLPGVPSLALPLFTGWYIGCDWFFAPPVGFGLYSPHS